MVTCSLLYPSVPSDPFRALTPSVPSDPFRAFGKQLYGWKFRRQHPYGDYVLDFVCIDAKLIVEVDGGQHVERRQDDEVRDACLRAAGFQVLRFWNNQVMQELEAVVETIAAALPATPPPSRPSP